MKMMNAKIKSMMGFLNIKDGLLEHKKRDKNQLLK